MNRTQDLDATLPAARPAAELAGLPDMLFTALRRAEAAVLLDLHEAFASEDMRALGYAAMVVLKQNPGMRQSQVSFALGIRATNFIPLLDGLEKRGLTERRGVPGDRRAKGLFLTGLGADTLARLAGLANAHEARLLARLGADGRQQLLSLLHRLSDSAFDPVAA